MCGGTPCVDTVVRQTEPDRHPSCFVRYVPAPDFDLEIIEALKFQRVLVPGAVARLTLKWLAADGKLYFAYEAEGSGSPFSSGRLTFRPGA